MMQEGWGYDTSSAPAQALYIYIYIHHVLHAGLPGDSTSRAFAIRKLFIAGL
jgi:hypothetical protein